VGRVAKSFRSDEHDEERSNGETEMILSPLSTKTQSVIPARAIPWTRRRDERRWLDRFVALQGEHVTEFRAVALFMF
jgi:hypothetical protein